MGPVNAAKIAAEAEVIRFQAMAKRQGIRAAFGILTMIFALGMLALLNPDLSQESCASGL